MPNAPITSKDLLDQVKRMSSEEFDDFISRAIKLRNGSAAPRLSRRETELVEKVNRGLSPALAKRYAQLAKRRDRRQLTDAEHQELLALTHEAETCDAERAAALLELATLRGVAVRVLVKQMGIEALPADG